MESMALSINYLVSDFISGKLKFKMKAKVLIVLLLWGLTD